ncbi:protein FRA10AC1 homolog isoform X2 [Antedon mediterranea]
MLYYPGATQILQRDRSNDKTDIDVIHENHRFLWTAADEEDKNWAKELAKKYWDKLFKEYCISDLSCYKDNKIALRWRVDNEVITGKGQFSCGNKRCSESEGLKTWEVNFGYMEHGEKKNALVKLRLCPDCSYKLNYCHQKKEVTKIPRKQKQIKKSSKKHKRKHKRKYKKSKHGSSSEESSNDEDEEDEDNSTSKEGSYTHKESNVWSGPVSIPEKKTREDEFEEYFEDMFL